MMFMNILLYYRELSLFCYNILNPVLIHIEYSRSVQKKIMKRVFDFYRKQSMQMRESHLFTASSG